MVVPGAQLYRFGTCTARRVNVLGHWDSARDRGRRVFPSELADPRWCWVRRPLVLRPSVSLEGFGA